MGKISIFKLKSLITASALSVVLVVTGLSPVMAGKDSAAVVLYSTDDGPHVFWQSDSTAIVFYLCDDSVDKRIFSVDDTLRFGGMCRDTGIEYKIPGLPPTAGPCIIESAPRIFAVSDIHGEYEHFLNILKNGGVIDGEHRWIWGDGHLVIVGDVTDRGTHVTECLWLIYRLEQQALAQGGRVHFILGNHELMVLRGDNRYVHTRYLKGIVKKTRIEHEDLYGPDMALGRWLRSKNSVIRIGDILFVHGGLSPEVTEDGNELKKINQTIRGYLDLSSSQLAFHDRAKLMFGSLGPFWYRGLFEERPNRYRRLNQDEVETILDGFESTVLVVGHTPIDTIETFYDKRVVAIDVDVETLGGLEALLWEDGRFYRVTVDGTLKQIK